jgi:multiple sugar transport system permease protein
MKLAKKKKKTHTYSRKERLHSACFLAPSLMGVMVFFLIPFLVVVYYSVVDNPISHNFVFLKNFQMLLKNAAFKKAATNTIKFSLTAVPLSVILSLGLAVLLESKIPGKSMFRTFFLSPMMVPVASVVLIWQVLFDYNGAVNNWLSVFGVVQIDWLKSKYSMVVIVLLFLWKNLGYNMILFMSALSSIPKEIIEVTRLDTSSRWLIFWKIKLRYLSPTLLFVTVYSLINSFKIFREIYLLTNDYPYDSLYMLQHFMNNTFNNLDYQKLSAAAILMSIVVVIIIGILFLLEDRFGKDVEG